MFRIPSISLRAAVAFPQGRFRTTEMPLFAHIPSLKIVTAWMSRDELDLYEVTMLRTDEERMIVARRRNRLPDSLRVWCDIFFEETRGIPRRPEVIWLYHMLHRDMLAVVNRLVTYYGHHRIAVAETVLSVVSHLNLEDNMAVELLRSWMSPLSEYIMEGSRELVGLFKVVLSGCRAQLIKFHNLGTCSVVFSAACLSFPDEELMNLFHSLGATVDTLIYGSGKILSEEDILYIAAGNHCISYVGQAHPAVDKWYSKSDTCPAEGTLVVPAVLSGDVAMLHLLIDKGFSVAHATSMDLMELAIRRGCISIAHALFVCHYRDEPLTNQHYWYHVHHPHMVNFLASMGLSVTNSLYFYLDSDIDVINCMIRRGAKLAGQAGLARDGVAPLAAYRSYSAIEFLLERGSDVGEITEVNIQMDSLSIWVQRGSAVTVELLLRYGADPNRTTTSVPALTSAIMSLNMPIVSLLAENGAQVRASPSGTVLHQLCSYHLDSEFDQAHFRDAQETELLMTVASWILNNVGVDINDVNSQGQTALDVLDSKDTALLRFLTDHGGDRGVSGYRMHH